MSRMKNRDSNRDRREQRQKEAAERQAAYDVLTVEEKLMKLGNLVAAKQRVQLAMAAHTAPAAVQEAVQDAPVDAPAKEKKGAKAKRQAKKDKKGKD